MTPRVQDICNLRARKRQWVDFLGALRLHEIRTQLGRGQPEGEGGASDEAAEGDLIMRSVLWLETLRISLERSGYLWAQAQRSWLSGCDETSHR